MERLGLEFIVESPDIDEHVIPEESAEKHVLRLAREKSEAIGKKYPDALIIGSDQIALLNSHIITKPLDYDTAVKQLKEMSGHTITFLTALSVINTKKSTRYLECVPYYVTFRNLNDIEIERYLKKEKPYDCAGGFKSEVSGISLVEKMEGTDPTSLIGLPLIRLSHILRKEGIELP